jgi:hypothetical protein
MAMYNYRIPASMESLTGALALLATPVNRIMNAYPLENQASLSPWIKP